MSLNKDFAMRVAIAVSAATLFLCFALYNSFTLMIVLFFFTLLAMEEYFKLLKSGGYKPMRFVGYLAVSTFLYISYNPISGSISDLHIALLIGFLLVIAAKGIDIKLRGRSNACSSAITTLFGALYIGGSISCIIGLNHIQQQVFPHSSTSTIPLVLLPLIGAWAADTGAYLAGRIVGSEQLSRISPNKTKEGFAGAMTAGFTATFLYGNMLGLDYKLLILLGILIPIVALAGDLFESAIKRRFNAKDSGTFFKNHGGVLDRFDSVFSTAPLTYFILYFFYM